MRHSAAKSCIIPFVRMDSSVGVGVGVKTILIVQSFEFVKKDISDRMF